MRIDLYETICPSNCIPVFAGMTKTPGMGRVVNKNGFTLIEIIVLIVMAGILIPVIIIPFAAGIRGSGKPEVVTKAMYLAHQRMEELMKYDYGEAALDLTTGFDPFATGNPDYPGEYEITYVDSDFNPSGTDAGYKRIVVRITDPEGTTYDVYSVVTNFP